MDNLDDRRRIIEEARKWIGARWMHETCVRYKAADCGLIIADIFTQCGLIQKPGIASYPQSWALHRDEERYLAVVEQYAAPVEHPLMGDIAVWRVGRTFSHGGVVVEWPTVIHAHVEDGVVMDDISMGPLSARPVRFYSIFRR